MSALWQTAPIPFLNASGAPYSGLRAFFFDSGTTTPRIVYKDAGLGIAHDHPVVANSAGIFPAIFMPPGDYKVRVLTGTGVTLWEADGVTTPGASTGGGGGGGGDADPLSLFRTGDLKHRYSAGVHDGWVRANGRSIGSASSGATERANTDCQALFEFLWGVTRLAVSGGRGSSSAGDWAAAKRINVPDFRGRLLASVTDLGAGDNGLISTATTDANEAATILGATGGQSTVTLVMGQMPAHAHGGVTGEAGAHAHDYLRGLSLGVNASSPTAFAENRNSAETTQTSAVGQHRHDIPAEGGGGPHTNLQPTSFVGIYIKL